MNRLRGSSIMGWILTVGAEIANGFEYVVKPASNPLQRRCAMQKGERLRKFRHVLFFTAISILAIGGGFYLTKPFFPNVSKEILPRIPDKITAKIMTPYWADRRFDRTDPRKDKIMLSKGDARVIDGIKIIYRGSANRSQFQLDVFVLDFDREMPFAHTIDVNRAKKGFRLAGKNFQLISAREHRVHLWHHKKRQF